MEAIRNTIVENIGGTHALAGKDNFTLDQVPDQSGKVAVVTGGSEGVGFGCTHTLLSKNIAKLYIVTRREEKGDEALKAIEEEFGASARDKVSIHACDLSDWTATAKTANEIAADAEKSGIHILINNAGRGIMTRQLAPTNGIDLHMAANVMGHVVFTSHLLPLLKKTAEGGEFVRIVNLASNLHEKAPPETKFASVEELNKDYGSQAQYGRSKLGNLLHAKWLNEHLKAKHPHLIANATHPGIVDTAQTNDYIHEAFPILGYGMSVGLKPFRKTQFEGCVSTMYAATMTTQGGQYIAPPKIVEKGSDKANDMTLADNLMKLTAKIVEQKTRGESSQKGCPFDEA